jgi:outer membrane protein assembly factor BamB
MKDHISHERLRELLDYNPETGVFTWNETIAPRARAGDAGYLTKEGYWRITIEGCVYFAGPLAIFCQGNIQRDKLCILIITGPIAVGKTYAK